MSAFEIFLLVCAGQGVFLALLLHFIPKNNTAANRTLSSLLLIAAISLATRVFYPLLVGKTGLILGTIGDTIIFTFGPLLMLYIHRLLYKNRLNWKQLLPHLLLPLAYLAYCAWILPHSYEEIIVLWQIGTLPILYFCIELLGLLSVAFYAFIGFKHLKAFQQKSGEQYSNTPAVTKFIALLLGVVGLLVIAWSISFLNQLVFDNALVWVTYNTMWIIVPLLFFLVGYYAFSQPAVFRLSVPNPVVVNPVAESEPVTASQKERLTAHETERLSQHLKQLMEHDKCYLDPQLSLSSLADKLGTSSNNLSWLLNKVHQQRFYEYVNQHRINAFLERIEQNAHHEFTILSLAMEVGFNSKSTFNKSFKTFVNETPSNYIKRLELIK